MFPAMGSTMIQAIWSGFWLTRRLHILQIIIGGSQGMFGQIPGNAQAVRNAKGCSA